MHCVFIEPRVLLVVLPRAYITWQNGLMLLTFCAWGLQEIYGDEMTNTGGMGYGGCVVCDATNSTVLGLFLSQSNLSGPFPTAVCDFPQVCNYPKPLLCQPSLCHPQLDPPMTDSAGGYNSWFHSSRHSTPTETA